MNWFFFDTGFNSGLYNMDFDIQLAENCKTDEVFFRLYRWKPYCISLGANQNYNSLNREKMKNDNIDLVKRPTGGRAILHSEEITYSVIYPLNSLNSLRNLYCEINKALKEGLKIYNRKLSDVELETEQPDLRKLYKNNLAEICFAVSAKSEIKYKGKKLIGSAQRKIGNTVLQHGSILCGEFHKRIIDYLYLNNEEYSLMKDQINNKTTDLSNVLGEEIDYGKLCSCLMAGFEKYFDINLLKEQEFKEDEEKILLQKQ